MLHAYRRLGLLTIVCLGLIGSNGCWTGKDDEGVGLDGDGMLSTMQFSQGEIPLGPRIDEGVPVSDVSFDNVQFAFDSFQIAATEVAKIEAVARYMRARGSVRLVLEGHCDERGSREYNISLGEHRALAVRAYLVGLGVQSGRMQTRSLGEEQPLDPGHDERAWWRNRRVVFRMFR